MKDYYKFNIINPIVDGKYVVLSNLRNSIFLAGPCPRDDFRDDQRYDAFDILDDLGFAGNVITPLNPEYKTFETANNLKDEIVLFGHIHGRSFAKRNGFDIASDYHQYAPLSIDQVEWFVNAMKCWDENVYSDHVNTTPK